MKPLARPALLAALLLAAAVPAAADDVWTVDKAHSTVGFEVRHLVSSVHGRFGDFSGTITGDPAAPESATVAFTIRTASISTNEEARDKHLRSADFFDAEKNPEITFRSTSIKPAGAGHYQVTGPLTMHGVTKEVTLDVALLGTMTDPWGSPRAGLEATVTLNRKDFGIVWNKVLDAGSTMLGDDVKVDINLEASKKAAKPAEKVSEKK